MRKELQDKLYADYPLIFKEKDSDPRTSPMAWGVSVGDGWYTLIDRLCLTIQGNINSVNERAKWLTQYHHVINEAQQGNYGPIQQMYPKMSRDQHNSIIADRLFQKEVPKPISQVVAQQVKEKFGSLRFYIKGGNDFAFGAIALAESLSSKICDVCGNPGKLGNQSLTFEEPKRDGVGGYYATRCKEHWGYQQ